MKLKLLFVLLFISAHFTYAQYNYEWSKYGISFSSSVKYDFEPMYGKKEDKSKLWRMDADDLGIEIEAVKIEDQSESFVNNIKTSAYEIAEDMGYEPIKEGGRLNGNFRGYFVTSIDIDHERKEYPVIIAAIIDDASELSFEIIIDCYDRKLQNGLNLLKSMKYTLQ